MASSLLNTSFLCSDFHVRNLLGVSVDADEHILITCKGVVKLYNVLDRRQVRSWSTKSWHPFTSAAVVDPASSNLIVVINGNSISQWSREEDDIDNVKRYNFEAPIHQLLVSADKVYIVFTNGEIEELQSALNTRRESKPGFLEENETITYVQIIESTNTALITTKREEASSPKLYELQLNQSGGRSPRGYNLAVADCTLTGLCALSSSQLITLWSNGDLYSFDLRKDSLEKLPGKKHATETSIIASKSTKILELSPTHIVIIGMGKGDEENQVHDYSTHGLPHYIGLGGLIVLRDLPFAMSVCSRKLKMYHDPPLAWVTPEGVVVAEGGSLALIPYAVKESNLATVFGTKTSEDCEYTSEVCRSWNLGTEEAVPVEAQETIYTNKSTELSHIIRDLRKDPLTESLLVTHLVNMLLKQKKTRLLNETLETFRDIPESCLVDVANYYLSCDDADFEGLCECPAMESKCIIPGDEPEEVNCPFASAKAHFMNGLLRKPFTDILLCPELYRLSFDNALSLIQYLHFILAAGEAELVAGDESHIPSVAQASAWLSLLLDTKYQHLVMTSQVDIHRLLLSCFTQVNNMRLFLEGLMDMEPLVKRVIEAKVLPPQTNSSAYSLERLTLT